MITTDTSKPGTAMSDELDVSEHADGDTIRIGGHIVLGVN